jgi:hypothetical protein
MAHPRYCLADFNRTDHQDPCDDVTFPEARQECTEALDA